MLRKSYQKLHFLYYRPCKEVWVSKYVRNSFLYSNISSPCLPTTAGQDSETCLNITWAVESSHNYFIQILGCNTYFKFLDRKNKTKTTQLKVRVPMGCDNDLANFKISHFSIQGEKYLSTEVLFLNLI